MIGLARALLVVPLAAVTLLAGAPSLTGPAEAAQRGFTYSVTTRGSVQADFATFRAVVDETLDDPRGWSLGGALSYTRVASGGDFQVILASPEQVRRAAPVYDSRYSCTVGDDVLINDERWRDGTSSWPRSLHEYRHYVVNHEVGHWLDLDHRDCPGEGRPAPVMQQQSISLGGCEATVWPLRDERLAVARTFGVRAALPFDRSAAVRPDGVDYRWIVTDDTQSPGPVRDFVWGRPTKNDVPVVGDWNGDGIGTAGVARPDGADWLWLLTDSVDDARLDHALRWGRPTKDDIPVVGDWNGDGRSTPGVVRPDGRDLVWLLNNRTSNPALAARSVWGRPTKDDRPVPGDWSQDGVDAPGVARPEGGALRWLLSDSTSSPRLSHDLPWGQTGDSPVPGDWNGEGVDTPGSVRGEGADLVWRWTDDLSSPNTDHELRWGRPTEDDVPVAGRWAL
jgi:hypothetical protein